MKSKWNFDNIFELSSQCKTKSEFYSKHRAAYKAAKKLGIFEQITAHMPKNLRIGVTPTNKKWTDLEVRKEFSKFNNLQDLRKNSPAAYAAAKKLGIFKEVSAYMNVRINKYSFEDCEKEAAKHNTKVDFKNAAPSIYKAARKMGILKDICDHMIQLCKKWDKEEVRQLFLKHSKRTAVFKENAKAYGYARDKGWLNEFTQHMGPPSNERYALEEVAEIAKPFTSRVEFSEQAFGAYQAASINGWLDIVCKHMKHSGSISRQEKELFDTLRPFFPELRRYKKCKIKMENKPHIKSLELDIFNPPAKRGIEYDGDYHHSIPGLERSHPTWPKEDIPYYHEIKDSFYINHEGIEVLHIKGDDWKRDKQACIQLAIAFLGGNCSIYPKPLILPI